MTLPFFDQPWLLVLAIVLPALLAALVITSVRRRRARLARLGTMEIVARLVPPAAVRPSAWRALPLSLAAACAAVAFAGPRWGTEPTIVRGEGIDLVLALDASYSMLATDDRPNRLARMKQEVRRLLDLSPTDRIGLLAFAGRSYILTPLTVDQGAIDLYLDNLEPSVVGQAGTSIARAIRQGTTLLTATKADADRALVIMSDGEGHETVDDVSEAARQAAAAGITVVTVGFGTREGSTLPIGSREGGGVKRDEQGAVVVSRYDPTLLRAAAEAARGTFIEAAASDKATRIRAALSALRTQTRAMSAGRDRKPRFQLFLIPAVLLLIVDTLLADRRGRRRRAATTASTAAGALLLLLLVPRTALADDARDAAAAYRAGRFQQAAMLYKRAVEAGERDPVVLYNYGTALLMSDSLARAAEVLERVATSRDPELRYRALFNLGLAHLRRGLALAGDSAAPALDAALESYRKVLLMRSRDADAKWNYELALREKRSGGGGGGGGGGAQQAPSPQPDPSSQNPAPAPRPAGGLGQDRAEQLLNSAARDERDVQARRQQQNRPTPPPGGKDW